MGVGTKACIGQAYIWSKGKLLATTATVATLDMKEATLLIVDDEPSFLESLSCALEEEFLVHKALNALRLSNY